MKQALYGWTDYPFKELGDMIHNPMGWAARVRACKVISYDRDKYCWIMIGEHILEVKRCYVYKKRGRIGAVQSFSHKEMSELTSEWPEFCSVDWTPPEE